jgi:co-chaperonin GroES (HSP10)
MVERVNAPSVGVTLEGRCEWFPEGTRLRMTSDRILLKPLPVEWSTVIEVVRHGRPLRGEVIAVGPGKHPLKYRPGEKPGTRRAVNCNHFQPTTVQVGDIVELGGANAFDGLGYQFAEVQIGAEKYVICTERDVAGVLE